MLFIDVDGFKNVNDTFGHGIDDVLARADTAMYTAKIHGPAKTATSIT